MDILPVFLAVFAAGWCLTGFYNIGLKAADYTATKTSQNYTPEYYRFWLFIMMFLSGPIGLGFWQQRHFACLISKLKKTD